MSLTLHPITSGLLDGRHQHYPTPGIAPKVAASEAAAEETAVRLLSAYHSISYLCLRDAGGREVRTYRRSDFFLSDSPLRHVRERVVAAELRALHRPVAVVAAAEFGEPPDCAVCGPGRYPCETIRALDNC